MKILRRILCDCFTQPVDTVLVGRAVIVSSSCSLEHRAPSRVISPRLACSTARGQLQDRANIKVVFNQSSTARAYGTGGYDIYRK